MGNSFSGETLRLTVSPDIRAGELTIENQGRRQLPVFRKGEGHHAR